MPLKILKTALCFFALLHLACTKYDCPPTVSSKTTVLCANVADYEFTGNTSDASSYNITATNSGAMLTTDRFGVANSAYSFNGANSYISADTNNRRVDSLVTISAWVKTNSVLDQEVVDKYDFVSNHGYNLQMNNGQAIFTWRDGIGGLKTSGYSTTLVSDGQWHLLTGIYRGTQGEIWVDGVLQNFTLTGHLGGHLGNLQPLSIGMYYQERTFFFTGEIDEVKIWSCALDSATIASAYKTP